MFGAAPGHGERSTPLEVGWVLATHVPCLRYRFCIGKISIFFHGIEKARKKKPSSPETVSSVVVLYRGVGHEIGEGGRGCYK